MVHVCDVNDTSFPREIKTQISVHMPYLSSATLHGQLSKNWNTLQDQHYRNRNRNSPNDRQLDKRHSGSTLGLYPLDMDKALPCYQGNGTGSRKPSLLANLDDRIIHLYASYNPDDYDMDDQCLFMEKKNSFNMQTKQDAKEDTI